MENEIPRGHLSTIILSSLLDGDKYGYEIIKAIEKQTNGTLKVKQPSLYSSLKRMEDQNLISSYWRDSDIGGRRHYYRLTDLGRKQTIEWQKDLINSQKYVKDIFEKSSPNDKSKKENKTTVLKQENLFTMTSNNEQNHQSDSFVQINLFEKNLVTQPVENEQFVIQLNNNQSTITQPYNVRDELLKARTNSSFSDFIKEEKLNNNQAVLITEDLKTEESTNIVNVIENKNDKYNDIISDTTTNQNNQLSQENEINDDAILITETIDINNLPHVKKIQPTSMIITNNADVNHLNKAQKNNYDKLDNSTDVDTTDYYENFENLNNYLTKNGYKFLHYKKSSNIEINPLKLQTKINLISFAIFTLLLSLSSIVIYCISLSKNLYLNSLFFIIPTITIFLLCGKYLSYKDGRVNKYKPNINSVLYQALLAIVSTLLIYAINLLLGLNINNILLHSSTFLFPIVSMICYISSTITNVVIQKKKSN